jgi:hypothetical protein
MARATTIRIEATTRAMGIRTLISKPIVKRIKRATRRASMVGTAGTGIETEIEIGIVTAIEIETVIVIGTADTQAALPEITAPMEIPVHRWDSRMAPTMDVLIGRQDVHSSTARDTTIRIAATTTATAIRTLISRRIDKRTYVDTKRPTDDGNLLTAN